MMAPELLRQLIQHDATVVRAHAVLMDQWNRVAGQNPLARELIQPADLQLASQLRPAFESVSLPDLGDYAAVMDYINHHQDDLSTGAIEWLKRSFK